MLVQGLGEAWALTWKSRTSLSSQERARKLDRIDYTKHRRAGKVWYFLDWIKTGRICSPVPQLFTVCMGLAADPEAAFPLLRIWTRNAVIHSVSHTFLRDPPSGRSSCHLAMLSKHSSLLILILGEIQGSALHALLSLATPRAGVTLPVLQTLQNVSLLLNSLPSLCSKPLTPLQPLPHGG